MADAARAPPIRVFLICRVHLYCTAIARLLRSDSAIILVRTANPGAPLLPALDAAAADVVLLDAGGANALQLAQNVIRERPATRILGFGVEEVPAEVIACAQAGLCGYVPSTASMRDLVAAIRCIAQGGTVCSPSMADGIFRHMRSASIEPQSNEAEKLLTRRQQQIVRLISDGLSNKEIARRLALGNSTVKNHVHEILDRLRVSCRSEVAARLRRSSYTP
jgi:two-component system, NarL family, nitrate/nitrite response regulator NarL